MYTRETELRHLEPNDVYKLSVILDDNNCWKKLMAIIPKDLTQWRINSDAANQRIALKYNNDHIRLIENAIKRPGESRLYSQILFDEWGTSGRRHERPTVGVLLQLLVQAELFRVADFVANNFLNEPAPARPTEGPAAKIDISLGDEIFKDVSDYANDSSYYPGTASLNENVNFPQIVADNNKDFYSKYKCMDKLLASKNEIVVELPPKAPPRTRTGRLQEQQFQPRIDETEATTAEAFSRSKINELQSQPHYLGNQNFLASCVEPVPKFSVLMATSSNDTNIETEHNEFITNTTNLSAAPIPIISALAITNELQTGTVTEKLPIISALNLNGEHDDNKDQEFKEPKSSSSSNSSVSNDSGDDDDDDDDNSVPNLSIFEQRSSNNDSSLTTVTGTSSFDLSMNDFSSSCSNDNIPCLSALKQ